MSFPDVLSDEVRTIEQRKSVVRNTFVQLCKNDIDGIESQKTRMQFVVCEQGILEQIGVLQNEVRLLGKEVLRLQAQRLEMVA
jgi:hypothetical protein